MKNEPYQISIIDTNQDAALFSKVWGRWSTINERSQLCYNPLIWEETFKCKVIRENINGSCPGRWIGLEFKNKAAYVLFVLEHS